MKKTPFDYLDTETDDQEIIGFCKSFRGNVENLKVHREDGIRVVSIEFIIGK